MSEFRKIPIVVLGYKDYVTADEFLGRFEESLRDVLELVFVDNCSKDGSFEKLQSKYGHLGAFIKTSENKGYASGNNFGLRYIKENISTDKVIISNPDIVFTSDMVKELSKRMDAYEDVKIASTSIVGMDGNKQVAAWKLPSLAREALSSLVITNKIFKLDKKLYTKEELERPEIFVEAVNGSFFMADMKALEEVDFFDEDTFLYCEENILGYKLKDRGYKELLVNDLSYIHKHNATIGKVFRKRKNRYLILQDSRRVYLKKYKKCGKLKMMFFNIASAIGHLERIWT